MSMIWGYLKMAFGDLVHRRKRTILTMIGIMIGIVSVIALISVGQALQNSIQEQFESIGTNLIMVMPGQGMESSFGPTSGGKLTDHDIDLIKRVRGVDLVGGMIAKYARVEYGGEAKYTFVIGLPTDDAQDIIFNMQQVKIEIGQNRFKPTDRQKVVIGYELAHKEFFKNNVGINSNMVINGRDFRVVSIIESLGNPSDDQQVYIPIEMAKEIFNTSDDYYALMVSVKPGFEPGKVADDISEKLRKDRDLDRGDEDFSVQTYEQLLQSVNSVLGVVQVVILGIAAISLLVGGIGIMNTMYTSVIERTNEIGIMKAVGARNSDIMMVFLFESGMIGLFGGIIGCAIGFGLAKIIEMAAISSGFSMLKVSINPELMIGTLAFSFIFGIFSGILPARQALKLKIVDALHYE